MKMERLKELRAEHSPWYTLGDRLVYCKECQQYWPCELSQVIDLALDALRFEVFA